MHKYIDQDGNKLVIDRGLNGEVIAMHRNGNVDEIARVFDSHGEFVEAFGPNKEAGQMVHL